MNKYYALIIKNIIYAFKIIQLLGLIYLLLFIIYWICDMMALSLAGNLDFLYALPIEVTENLMDSLGINVSSEFAILKPTVFFSIIFATVVYLIYNIIFIPLGRVEEYYVNKSYENDEHDF